MRSSLRRDLARAIKARDGVAAAALRSALAAIDNAEAVDPPPRGGGPAQEHHIAGSVAGLGATEAERRDLTAAEVEEIVRREMVERLAAAGEYERLGHIAPADRLREEARVLSRFLPEGESVPPLPNPPPEGGRE
ncbi:MAG: GatB/YqeY domain-containing protein [Candidatus Dormibacteraeota bacterium]|nr:GatB/YqeY domain-containing protein [Candidatus Dormibacteraeota bacterium]